MKIVDVCAFYTPHGGGVRTYVQRKLTAAALAGHEMIVLAPGECNEWRELPGGGVLATIEGPRLPVDRRYRYFGDEQALHRELDAWNPDVVEASSPWSSASMVARWPGPAKRSLIMHADPMSAYAYRWFGRIASTAAIDRGFDWFWRHLRKLDSAMDLVVCASDDLTARLTAGGLKKTVTIPMGVEPGLFSQARRDPSLRADLLAQCGLPASATLLLGVGRYSAEKRWEMVVEAAVSAGVVSPIGLVLVGEGRGRRGITARAAGSPHIVVSGPLRDRTLLATMIASTDALVHGCEAETFCMVAAEAAASGTPVIGPDRGGASDHVRSSSGLHYRATDAASLRKALITFAEMRASGFGQGGHAPARTIDQHFDDLFAAYDGISSRRALAA